MQRSGQNIGGSGLVHSEFGPVATGELVSALSVLLSEGFALFIRTKRLQWRLPGPDLCDRRALLARQAFALLALVDRLALRIRVLGRLPATSSEGQLVADETDNDASAAASVQRLCADNQQLLSGLREAHGLCEEYGDVATSRLLARWIDETESRVLVLFEIARPEAATAKTQPHP